MKLLVVEDDSRVADFLDRGLRAAGYGVSLARSGPEGLAMARTGEPALVLLDVMLPGLSGIDLCQTLRAEGRHAPVLMLTAMSALDDKVAGLRLGADDYLLTKPFAFDELLAGIDALLNMWGFNEDPLTNVVDVYVKRLRGKIDEGRATPLLKTVRGFGYRLDAGPE